MILLLSKASNLYWLGRFMIRIDGICRLLPFTDDHEALEYSQAFGLPAWDSATLNQLMYDASQPASIPSNLQVVRENMQYVRGVISQELFECLNILTSPRQQFKDRACGLISDCCETIIDEDDNVRLFWQLGQSIEQIDIALRLKHSPEMAILDLRTVIEMLSPIGWQALEAPWVELQQRQDITALYNFCDQMQASFEEGP
ncbi:alpha-E domain-containing protein [Alkanindiges sp. WGS2144]|uniref:alpha-E domain-containing protein n=1 Tax=Alkanindiges sp. WGS2144 TaxID=3366808 RepID=UPI00374FF225